MIVFARDSITDPNKLGPFVDDEMCVVNQLKDEGVMKAVYRRAAGPRVLLILERASIDAIRARASTTSPSSRGTHDTRIRGDLRDLRRRPA
jgi:hypothetical protein